MGWSFSMGYNPMGRNPTALSATMVFWKMKEDEVSPR